MPTMRIGTGALMDYLNRDQALRVAINWLKEEFIDASQKKRMSSMVNCAILLRELGEDVPHTIGQEL